MQRSYEAQAGYHKKSLSHTKPGLLLMIKKNFKTEYLCCVF